MQGSLCDLPVLTAEERDTLLMAAWELNQYAPPLVDGPRPPHSAAPTGQRPGDDFNARGDIRPYLVKAGCTFTRTIGDNEHWRRPGKKNGSASATFNGKCFYVFSTNAHPFEGGQGYSPFAVYALLDHGGDYAAAASSLAQQGFGAQDAALDPAAAPGASLWNVKSEKPTSAGDQAGPMSLVCLADVEVSEVSWLWPMRILLGMISLLAGDGGNAANRCSARHEQEIAYLKRKWGPYLDHVKAKGTTRLVVKVRRGA